MDTEFVEDVQKEASAAGVGRDADQNQGNTTVASFQIQELDRNQEDIGLDSPDEAMDNPLTNEAVSYGEDIVCIRQLAEKTAIDIDIIKTRFEDDIFKKYAALVNSLQMSVAANKAHEESIYKELEIARKGEHYSVIRPFLEFAVDLHAELLDYLDDYESDSENVIAECSQKGYDDIVALIKYFYKKVEGALPLMGIKVIKYENGETFNVVEQMALKKTVDTSDDILVGKVANVQSFCYKYEDKVVRKAKVNLYKKQEINLR